MIRNWIQLDRWWCFFEVVTSWLAGCSRVAFEVFTLWLIMMILLMLKYCNYYFNHLIRVGKLYSYVVNRLISI